MAIRLFRRKTCWVPTAPGWLAIAAIAAAAGVGFVTGIHPFLAENRPFRGEALIVEGWVPDEGLRQVVRDFRARGYRFIIATGGPLEKGSYLAEYQSFAALTAATLLALGVDSAAIRRVPAPLTARDRTFESARAVKAWMGQSGTTVASADLYTYGPHARRSLLLFRRALGPRTRLGVVSLACADYDPKRWWMSSIGFRAVIGESIAYVYARFLFRGR